MTVDASRGQIILIDDEDHVRDAGRQALELAGFKVRCFERAADALANLSTGFDGVVVSDIKMPGIDGMQMLKKAQQIDADLPVVLITGHGDIAMAVEAIRGGAYEFIEKPFAADRLVDIVNRAMEKRRLVMENRALRDELTAQAPRIIGRSPTMERMRQLIAGIADTDADVLVIGETGAGKEMVARSLHEQSARRSGHFVAINCGAMPETIFESELFGHEPGSFTGAAKQRIGKIEHSSGGTLFLDEIESMPLSLQVKLLRVLQERVVERLGSNELHPVDLRVVAATKTDLKAAGDKGAFRPDLYYRLNVVTVEVPPLRDRREDLPLLFQFFVDEAARRFGRETPSLSPEATRLLLGHSWPGNVRELKNVAERFVLTGSMDTGEADPTAGPTSQNLSDQVRQFERSLILQELRRHNGNASAAMEALGVPRKTFYDKLHKHGLDRTDF